jgi:hypothetical protein
MMISLPTFILVTDKHSDKEVYINPTQIICIRPTKTYSEETWKVIFCNDIYVIVDSKGLKTITDHSEVLINKI